MANNHEQFIEFHRAISISEKKISVLKQNRTALRDRIRKYYKDNHPDEIAPKFKPQGSFAMKTLLEPIKTTGTLGVFDLDDGVYFIGEIDERKSISHYHARILSAVNGHTSQSPIDKDTCVRVEYSDGHHVDLPKYFKETGENTTPMLAHKSKGWIESDPKEFWEWFNEMAETNPQLRRIVKYLKAWCDYKESLNTSINMPSGCILTILAVKFYKEYENRDDLALKNVLVNMHNSLSLRFECHRPTTPAGENLFLNYSDTRREQFMTRLKSFKEDAERAINNTNPKDACEKWQTHLGDRFSCSSAKDEDERSLYQPSSPTILKGNSKFA